MLTLILSNGIFKVCSLQLDQQTHRATSSNGIDFTMFTEEQPTLALEGLIVQGHYIKPQSY